MWEPATPSETGLVTDKSDIQVTETEIVVLFLAIILSISFYLFLWTWYSVFEMNVGQNKLTCLA